MRETAANGSAVANLIVRHMPDRIVQQGMILLDFNTALDVAPPRQRTDRQSLIIEPDRREIREPSDIDQSRRRSETVGQHWNQTLSARDDFGFALILAEQSNRMLDAFSPMI